MRALMAGQAVLEHDHDPTAVQAPAHAIEAREAYECANADDCAFGSRLMTTLGLIEGEILTFLDDHGAGDIPELVQQLGRPGLLVTMAVGALIRDRLVRVVCRDGELLLVDRGPERSIRYWPKEKRCPEFWDLRGD